MTPNLNFDPRGKIKVQDAVFFLFCLTTIQLVFQEPYIVILHDERAKVFSATLCLLTLTITILFGCDKQRLYFSADFWISLTLALVALLSGIFSVAPRQSLERAYVILSAGLGGYWCAKFLLTEPNLRRIFQWFVNALLVGVIFLALIGLYLTGKPHQFLDSHWHPVGSRLLSMSFAPLSLIFGDIRSDQIIGGIILLVDLIAIYIVGRYAFIESILIIPAVVSVIAFVVFKWTGKSRRIVAMIIAVTVTAGIFFAFVNPKKLNRNHVSVAYRVESLFFSIDIASRHPWLGNGLWAPRDSFLKDYKLHYPFVSKEQFSQWVKEFRTSENLYLTFLADLGVIFVLLYFGSVLYILIRLIGISRGPCLNLIFHPAAILLPLIAECLRFLVVDDLFEPQISWFFHILLGLVAAGIVATCDRRVADT
ncbi:MAG: O-antigen ligase family protein [Pseudomonadota bacterium]